MPNPTTFELPYVNNFLHLLVKCTWPLGKDVFNGQWICAVPQSLYLKSLLWSSLPGKLVISNKHQFLLSKVYAWRVLLYFLMVKRLGGIHAVWGHWDVEGFSVTNCFDSVFHPFQSSLYWKIKFIKCPIPLSSFWLNIRLDFWGEREALVRLRGKAFIILPTSFLQSIIIDVITNLWKQHFSPVC